VLRSRLLGGLASGCLTVNEVVCVLTTHAPWGGLPLVPSTLPYVFTWVMKRETELRCGGRLVLSRLSCVSLSGETYAY